MKNAIYKSPLDIVIAICDDKKGEEVEEYLHSAHLDAGLLFMGKGTAESEIADLFGFGMNNRDIVAVMVPVEKTDKVVKRINDITEKYYFSTSFILALYHSLTSVFLPDLLKSQKKEITLEN